MGKVDCSSTGEGAALAEALVEAEEGEEARVGTDVDGEVAEGTPPATGGLAVPVPEGACSISKPRTAEKKKKGWAVVGLKVKNKTVMSTQRKEGSIFVKILTIIKTKKQKAY